MTRNSLPQASNFETLCTRYHLNVTHSPQTDIICLVVHHVLFCNCVYCFIVFCVAMGPRKELTKERITTIPSLSLGGKAKKEIAAITGVAMRSVQCWAKNNGEKLQCRDAVLPPHQNKKKWEASCPFYEDSEGPEASSGH